jgi:hypothetical protein
VNGVNGVPGVFELLSGATLTGKGTNNVNSWMYAVNVHGGVFNLKGGKIKDFVSEGGIIYVNSINNNGAAFNMESGEIVNNKIRSSSVNMAVYAGGPVAISGGVIRGTIGGYDMRLDGYDSDESGRRAIVLSGGAEIGSILLLSMNNGALKNTKPLTIGADGFYGDVGRLDITGNGDNLSALKNRWTHENSVSILKGESGFSGAYPVERVRLGKFFAHGVYAGEEAITPPYTLDRNTGFLVDVFRPVSGVDFRADKTQLTRGKEFQFASLEAVAVPLNATGRVITWSVKSAGGGISSVDGVSFIPTEAGKFTLQASVADGKAFGVPYTRDIEFTVTQKALGGTAGASGVGLPGETLEAALNKAVEIYAPLYQWQQSADGAAWQDISGEAASSYKVIEADRGKQLRVRVRCAYSSGELLSPAKSVMGAGTPYTLQGLYRDVETAPLDAVYAAPGGTIFEQAVNWLTVDNGYNARNNTTYTLVLADNPAGLIVNNEKAYDAFSGGDNNKNGLRLDPGPNKTGVTLIIRKAAGTEGTELVLKRTYKRRALLSIARTNLIIERGITLVGEKWSAGAEDQASGDVIHSLLNVISGTTEIRDGVTLRDNEAGSSGGAVTVNEGTFNMKGGLITGCSGTSHQWGGGAVLVEYGAVNMSGGSIINNHPHPQYRTSSQCAGIFVLYSKSRVSVTGGTIKNNSGVADIMIPAPCLTVGGNPDIGSIALMTYHDGRDSTYVSVRPDFTGQLGALLLTNGILGGDPRYASVYGSEWVPHWAAYSGGVALRWAEGGAGPLPVSKFPLQLVDSYSYARQAAVGFSINPQTGVIEGSLQIAAAQ